MGLRDSVVLGVVLALDNRKDVVVANVWVVYRSIIVAPLNHRAGCSYVHICDEDSLFSTNKAQ